MIRRLILLAIRMLCIWSTACAAAWVGGAYMYSIFNGIVYSPGWYDIEAIARTSLVISLAFVLAACLGMGRRS